MTYAILPISAAAYADVRRRLVEIDEKIGGGLNQYQRDFILPGPPERIVFGETALEALPPEIVTMTEAREAEHPFGPGARAGWGMADVTGTPYVDAPSRPIAPLMTDTGKGAWEQVIDLFHRHGLDQPPVKLRDEIVCMLTWGRYALALERYAAAPHVDDLNDRVLVGLALEDDARALLEALKADPSVFVTDEEADVTKTVGLDGCVDLVALARVLRRRYLPWTLDDWKPTAEAINALPEPLRAYIHDLETRADPAGEVLEMHQVRQQAAGVEAMYLASERLLAGVRRIMHKWEAVGFRADRDYLTEISALLSNMPGIGRGLLAGETAEEFRQRQVDEVDGRRWRALMRVARIRMFGSAGVDHETGARTEGDYVHFGAEFWSTMGADYDPAKFPAQHNNDWGIKALTALADAVLEREAREAQAGKV